MLYNKICKGCGAQFTTEDGRQKYCCKKCLHEHFPHHRVVVNCAYCGKPKEIYPSRNDGRPKFCNKTCMDSRQKTSRPPAVGKKRLAKVCFVCRRTFKGCKKHTKFCSTGCRLQYLNEYPYKDNNPAWRGGTVAGRRKLETTAKYQGWRKAVFKRDKYRCVLCGSSKYIQAHHIKPLSLYPKLATRLSNGATLCKECHLKTYAKENKHEYIIKTSLTILDSLKYINTRVSIV